MGQPAEKRRCARLDMALSVSFAVESPGGKVSPMAEALSSDISAGGLRLMTPQPLQNGSLLNLEIQLPDDNIEPIRACGEVVWQNKLSDFSYETGTLIKSMDEIDKRRFMGFVFDQMSRLVGSSRNPNSHLN